MKQHKKKKFAIALDEQTHRKIKILAVHKGLKITNIATEALNLYADKELKRLSISIPSISKRM